MSRQRRPRQKKKDCILGAARKASVGHLDSSFGSTVWRADVGCAKEDVVEAMYRKVVKSVHSHRGHVADAQPLQVAVERRNRFRASAEPPSGVAFSGHQSPSKSLEQSGHSEGSLRWIRAVLHWDWGH